jgi:hypothetical protein
MSKIIIIDEQELIYIIEKHGYNVTSEYYNGGFDINNGEYFIGVFENYLNVITTFGDFVETISLENQN